MGFLDNKRFLVTGLASTRSIANGIAQALHAQGASLAFTYQNEKLKKRVEGFAAGYDSNLTFECDVAKDEDINNLFKKLGEHWDGLDGIIHAIAFAPGELLEGDYLQNMNRAGFNLAHNISSYSFAALARAGRAMMQGRNGSLITLSYLGAERVIPNYNVMGVAKASLEANMRYLAASLGPEGIRVNAVSAGPIRTLASSGIKGFRKMLDYNEKITPLRHNVTIEQVGNVTAFLCSDLASGITGEIVHVDAGYHIVGMPAIEEA